MADALLAALTFVVTQSFHLLGAIAFGMYIHKSFKS
jgi:hypothetical protein